VGALEGHLPEPVDFNVVTDPEPFTIIVVGVLVAGCVLHWAMEGGRRSCMDHYAQLAEQCIESGGSPDIQVHSTLGVSWRGGRPNFGCNLTCDFVCHQGNTAAGPSEA
jgi:hypothetical protein